MQKIERWRIQELALILKDLVDTLHNSDNRDWANVFEHYLIETERILLRSTFNLEECKRLVRNILCCYLDGDSFRRLEITHEEPDLGARINKDLTRQKAQLYHLLTDLQARFVEYIH